MSKELIECEDCDGQGEIATTSPSECNKSQSDCCGGCFGEETCDICNGTGKIDNEETDSEHE